MASVGLVVWAGAIAAAIRNIKTVRKFRFMD
jgi:hypothetical protein